MPPSTIWRLRIDIWAASEAYSAAFLVDVKGFDVIASPIAHLSDAIDPPREEIIEWSHSRHTLKAAMAGYAGPALNGESLLTASADGRVLTVVSIGQVAGETVVDIGLIARVVDERVVIDRDVNNKLLVDALLQAGIPRRQIVLAYAGESVIDAA